MTLLDSSSVAVDGAALRRIREEKRLTQFYVSKVVGVTTDTVSRWENNRYPTIRRDNAVKLAEALEVDLDEILKQDVQAQTVEEIKRPAILATKTWLLAVLMLIVLSVLWFFYVLPDISSEPQLQVQRVLPPHVAPEHELLVQLVISTQTPIKGMILKEEFPPGWEFISSEPEATSVDVATGIARWIFRNPETNTHVYYRLGVPRDVQLKSEITVSGELIANPDGQQFILPLNPDQRTMIKPFHWADTNANYVIDDMEILIFSELTENTSELDDEWYQVEQIWHSGSYRWDEVSYRFVLTNAAENLVPTKTDDN